jgi:hypothetical protein
VAAAPHEVALTFTQNLEAAFSTVQVTDSKGARVDQGKPQISGNTMHVGLKPLAFQSIRTKRREIFPSPSAAREPLARAEVTGGRCG